jgi:hypothetical protein
VITLQKAAKTMVIFCFCFLQVGFSCFFFSKMSVEENLAEKLQRKFREKLQKLKEEQERLRE